MLPKISMDCLTLKKPSPSASIPQDPIAVQACQLVKQDVLSEIPNALIKTVTGKQMLVTWAASQLVIATRKIL